jgi:hypothetical protein
MKPNFKTVSIEELAAMDREKPKASPRKAMKAASKKPENTTTTKPTEGFVNADDLLAALFPSEKSRPSARWLRDRTQAGDIPSTKLGGLTFYDVAKVRAVLNGERPALTEAQIASMGETELWAEYGKLLETKGTSAAHSFYKKHIKGKA